MIEKCYLCVKNDETSNSWRTFFYSEDLTPGEIHSLLDTLTSVRKEQHYQDQWKTVYGSDAQEDPTMYFRARRGLVELDKWLRNRDGASDLETMYWQGVYSLYRNACDLAKDIREMRIMRGAATSGEGQTEQADPDCPSSGAEDEQGSGARESLGIRAGLNGSSPEEVHLPSPDVEPEPDGSPVAASEGGTRKRRNAIPVDREVAGKIINSIQTGRFEVWNRESQRSLLFDATHTVYWGPVRHNPGAYSSYDVLFRHESGYWTLTIWEGPLSFVRTRRLSNAEAADWIARNEYEAPPDVAHLVANSFFTPGKSDETVPDREQSATLKAGGAGEQAPVDQVSSPAKRIREIAEPTVTTDDKSESGTMVDAVPAPKDVEHTAPATRKWPKPEEYTTAKFWTRKDGTVCLSAKTGPRHDGAVEFAPTVPGQLTYQMRFIQLMCFKFPNPATLAEVIEQVYPDDLANLERDPRLLKNRLCRLRSLVSDIRRKKLAKAGP